MMSLRRTFLSFPKAADALEDGDVLLFTACDFAGELINTGTLSEWSHAAIAGKWGKVWYALEENGSYNPRGIIPLKEYRQSRKGHIDVFRCNLPFSAETVLDRARFLTAKRYAWGDIARQCLMRAPFLRFLWRKWTARDGYRPDGPFFCSATVEDCYRAGMEAWTTGEPRLVKNKPIHSVMPADLGQSAALDYQFSIRR